MIKALNGKILNDKESKTMVRALNRENPSNPISETEIDWQDEVEEIDTSEPSRAEGHLKNT